ncbi:PAS domain S-box-containing protein [Salsuginibacillus halophilus]|uniref:histidine kinase n=1 Tax=Salsuginibacillus halophilus TaxID=517424 RepID=A0A2P8H886_9BACI|nr:ATP-binding protein [Salsuginibacillus halophilus]PSL42414.1 PAS domain S-box-containing protein [Salsuginibacillus halophilus]
MKLRPQTQSIRSEFLWKSSFYIAVIAIISIIIGLVIFNNQKEQVETREEMVEKVQVIEDLQSSISLLFYYGRGYLAFQNEEDLSRVDEKVEAVQFHLNEYRALELESDEELFIEELDSFVTNFSETIFPESVAFVQEDDYEGLRTLSQTGTTESIDEFIAESGELQSEASQNMKQQYESAVSDANRNIMLGAGLTMLVFFVMLIGSQRLLSRLVDPIEELTSASDELARGNIVNINASDRQDEVGSLARSFEHMATSIQENEEELQAQNEELQAQQEMLEDALDQTQKEKIKIDRYSQLNQTMSTKLDKGLFLTSIFHYVNELYPNDRSILYLLDEDDYRSTGMTDTGINQWKLADKSVWIHRLTEEPHIHIKREASNEEKGIAEGTVEAHDYYTAVRNSNGRVFALFACTRFGRPYTEEEMEEIESLMNHVALGLERSVVYEEISRARKLSQDILDNVNEAIQFIDIHGSMLQSNRAMERLLGLRVQGDLVSQEKWMEQTIDKAKEEQELEAFYQAMLDQKTTDTLSQQFELKDGSQVITVYGTAVFDEEERIGTVFVYRDMTREHELDKMKSELVSTVSHELRTPLSSVLGFTELLITKDLKPERQKRYLTTIHKEAKRLTNLINDFLDLQRMEAGSQPYEMEDLSMDTIAMDVIYQFKNEAQHRLSFIDQSYSAKVEGDKERLYQVLTNLVSNAVKFSPEGGEVTIHFTNTGKDLLVAVEDEGLGIPPEAKDSLFNKFQRIDNSDRRNIGGTGLGLAICREIVERHGGKIWVESEVGNGSTFFFRLPLQYQQPVRTVTTPEGYPQGASVVIVEDDTSLALLLSEELRSHGFRVIHHLNPDHAYRDIVRTIPAAVVVDLMLGETTSGWDLVHRLKEEETTRDLPIIISSALDRSDDKVQKYGIDQYLTKPYPPQDLSAALLKCIQENRGAGSGAILFPDKE